MTPVSCLPRTITQLKNAGSLRLISNKQASDSVVSYNNTVDDNISLFNNMAKLFSQLKWNKERAEDMINFFEKKYGLKNH